MDSSDSSPDRQEPRPAGGKGVTPAVLALLALGLILARLHTYAEPLERDITGYAVIAHELLAGRRLYAEVWDHKPPAIHATYAAAEWFAGYGPDAVFLLNLVAAATTLLGAYVAGRALGASAAAGLVTAAFWTIVSGDLVFQANQPNTEVFINAALTWAFALVVGAGPAAAVGRWWGIAALLALGSLYKHVVVVVAVLLAAAHLALPPRGATRRRALGQAGIVTLVGAAAWAVVATYFAATGRWTDFRDAVFTYNRTYAAPLSTTLAAAFGAPGLGPLARAVCLPLAALTATALVTGWRAGQRREALLLTAFLLGAHLAMALPGRFFPHYFQLWLPPLAIGAGWGVALLGRAHGHHVWRSVTAALATLAILLGAILPQYRLPPEEWTRRKYQREGEYFLASAPLAREIDGLLAADETFYEWGAETGLYFASGRRPPTGLTSMYPLLAGPLTRTLAARVVADLERARPELVVVARAAFPPAAQVGANPVTAWIAANYRPFPGTAERGPFALLVRTGGALAARLAAPAHSAQDVPARGGTAEARP